MIITIDGPAASGKSTIAKALAHKLNFHYLYTGMFYRAAAYIITSVLKKKPTDHLTQKDLELIQTIIYKYEGNNPHIFFNGTDITSFLFSPFIDQAASIVSANPIIRKALLIPQRNTANNFNLIAEGRDCGSVIFPHADYKFFITASLEVRAKRKMKDYGFTFETMKHELTIRDERDKNREFAPLVVPENAILVDTSALTSEEAIEKVISFIKK